MLPKAVLFDLDDTILDDSGCVEQSWTDACDECCPKDEISRIREAIRVAAAWFWADPVRHRIGRLDMKMARRQVAALALREVGHDDALADSIASAYARHRDARIRIFPDALDTLTWFTAKGCSLALVTNGSQRTQRMKICRFNLEPLFDAIFVEGELGFGKPDPRVFKLALDRLQRSPSEVWMVGDNLEWDVAAPQALGIYAVWVDGQGRGVPDGSTIRPDWVVRSISELRNAFAM
jgi:putative hydrolase of the HAD superfamily